MKKFFLILLLILFIFWMMLTASSPAGEAETQPAASGMYVHVEGYVDGTTGKPDPPGTSPVDFYRHFLYSEVGFKIYREGV